MTRRDSRNNGPSELPRHQPAEEPDRVVTPEQITDHGLVKGTSIVAWNTDVDLPTHLRDLIPIVDTPCSSDEWVNLRSEISRRAFALFTPVSSFGEHVARQREHRWIVNRVITQIRASDRNRHQVEVLVQRAYDERPHRASK